MKSKSPGKSRRSNEASSPYSSPSRSKPSSYEISVSKLDKAYSALSSLAEHIDICDAKHHDCHAKQNSDTILPSRVLDLGDGMDCDNIRLCSNNGGRRGLYAALSYCWGALGANYTTTMSNIREHHKSISWNKLPKTIRDAILIAKWLGIRYLWVDALCIIQRCPEDWEVESARMASVYKNAYITIDAAAPRDCREGFLSQHWIETNSVQLRENGRSGIDLPLLPLTIGADISRELFASPIFTRAWTLQEFILSPRNVLFTKKGVLLLCNKRGVYIEGCRSSTQVGLRFPHYLRNPLQPPREAGDPRWPKKPSQLDVAPRPPGAWYMGTSGLDRAPTEWWSPTQTWWQWVSSYSARKLTHRSDRIAAMAGITQYFAEQTGYTSFLGMWTERLLEDLHWRPLSHKGTAFEESSPIYPSWTWLAYKGSICLSGHFNRRMTTPLAEVVRSDHSWEGPPLTGRMLSSCLQIRCVTFKASLGRLQSDQKWAYLASLFADPIQLPEFQEHSKYTLALTAPTESGACEEIGGCLIDSEYMLGMLKEPEMEVYVAVLHEYTHEPCYKETIILVCEDPEPEVQKFTRVGVGIIDVEYSAQMDTSPRIIELV